MQPPYLLAFVNATMHTVMKTGFAQPETLYKKLNKRNGSSQAG